MDIKMETEVKSTKTIPLPLLCIEDLLFCWQGEISPILKISELIIKEEERLFLAGESGSGKSTLLGLISGVISPQKGRITANIREKTGGCSTELTALRPVERDSFRADNFGVIFQQFNLIPSLSMIENITLPCLFSELRKKRVEKRSGSCRNEAQRLLSKLELEENLWRQPVAKLSVGQQQRVAAARALMGRPKLIIADEPTSSLDSGRRQAFLELLFAECHASGSALLFVSHDKALASHFDRSLLLSEINLVEKKGAETHQIQQEATL